MVLLWPATMSVAAVTRVCLIFLPLWICLKRSSNKSHFYRNCIDIPALEQHYRGVGFVSFFLCLFVFGRCKNSEGAIRPLWHHVSNGVWRWVISVLFLFLRSKGVLRAIFFKVCPIEPLLIIGTDNIPAKWRIIILHKVLANLHRKLNYPYLQNRKLDFADSSSSRVWIFNIEPFWVFLCYRGLNG